MKIFGKDCGCASRRRRWMNWLLDHPTAVRTVVGWTIAALAFGAIYALPYIKSVYAEPYINVQTCLFSSEDTGSQLGNVCDRLDPATHWALRQRI